MAKKSPYQELSKREREVMDIVLRLGEATVKEVFTSMNDAPSYNSVRATMTVMVEKGHLRFRREGKRFIYKSSRPKERTRSSALQHLVANFFDGSTTSLVSTLLDLESRKLSESDYKELMRMIREARQEKT
ncbi:MAG: BlaI/MecI/CopY family transcriptional regulator [Planctomycetota bacterium]